MLVTRSSGVSGTKSTIVPSRHYSCSPTNRPFVRYIANRSRIYWSSATTASLSGIQVKTRELDQAPLKSRDAAVFSAFCRFCVRDARFQQWFRFFILTTNFVFYEGEGADDPRAILTCAKSNPTFSGLRPRDKVRTYIEDIARKTTLSIESVIGTLAKISLEERRTGIDEPDLELLHALGRTGQYAHLRMDQLLRGVRALREHIWNASSLALEGLVFDTHEVTADFAAHLGQLRAARKRIDMSVLTAALMPCLSADTAEELLAISGFLAREAMPRGLGRMELKMAAGSVSYADVEQMKDDVASLESTFVRWKERYGLAEANRRLAHFEYLALRDARVAEHQERRADAPYGSAMLNCLRMQARRTWIAEKDALFNCRSEHLVGAAGLLSEECRIWWSELRAAELGDGHVT